MEEAEFLAQVPVFLVIAFVLAWVLPEDAYLKLVSEVVISVWLEALVEELFFESCFGFACDVGLDGPSDPWELSLAWVPLRPANN